jgi:HSP20 family protein
MTRLARIDPFNHLVDDIFRGFLVRPVDVDAALETHRGARRLRLDVEEHNGAYLVHADLPGVRKEDIQVSVDGAQVTLAVEAKAEREATPDTRLLHSERHFGKVSRSFTLPEELDDAAVEAKYRDGVLELRLPKKAAPARKAITIQ